MRLVMFVRISRCPEYQSSYLPFEENHAQTKCANLTTETVFNNRLPCRFIAFKSFQNRSEKDIIIFHILKTVMPVY